MPYQKFKDLALGKTFLEIDTQGKPATNRLRVIIAILMWEMASMDGSVEEDEVRQIIELMNNEFHIIDSESEELLDIAQEVDSQRGDLDDLIAEINQHFDLPQRQHVFDMVWQVAKTDRHLVRFEEIFAAYLRNKLILAEDYLTE